MRKSILERFLVGLAAGELIGIFINIVVSLCSGNGQYIAVMPQLSSRFKYEINAVIVQYLMVGGIGVIFAEATLIFNIEKWSFLKKCIVHFIITAAFYTPFMYICYMPQNMKAVIIMLLTFIFNYAIIWFIEYKVTCSDVRQINERIQEVRKHESD